MPLRSLPQRIVHESIRFTVVNRLVGHPIIDSATYQGPPGANGADGADGVDGADGADGVDGVDGVDGSDGASGSLGVYGDGSEGDRLILRSLSAALRCSMRTS